MEEKKVQIDKKILFSLIGILSFLIIFLIIYFFFLPRFRFSDFDEKIDISFANDFSYQSGNVCYGTFFNCEKVKVLEEGSVDTSKLGSYKVTYVFSYNDKKISKDQIVNVVDNESPVIEINGEEPLNYCANGKGYGYKVLATDNYDGDISDKVTSKIVDDKIVFEVVDSSGNKGILEKKGILNDKELPIIKLNGESSVFIPLNGEYIEANATATDNCDGDLTNKITIDGSVDETKAGEYKLVYKVKDSNNNESSTTRYVYVYQASDYPSLDGKNVYLTFDDGPSKYTGKLLDVLKKYNVKATFFVTDQGLTKGYDDVLKRAYDEGHTIGLHSASHNYGYIYSNLDAYFNDLYAIQDKVKRITGFAPMIVRFPGGGSNTISANYDNGSHIMSMLTKAVQAKGFRYFDWNVDSKDANGAKTSAQVASNVINSLGNKNTYVVLQHDIKEFSVDAVETIIQFGLSHGYSFQALKMDSPRVEHRINN